MQRRKRRKGALFELGGYWIGTVPGTENLYRFWVEPGSRTVRRRSMGTADLEQAKADLAGIVLGQAPAEPLSPEAVTIATVLEHYWRTHSDATRGEYQARRAGELLVEWLLDERDAPGAQVGQFTTLWQEEFMRWCATAKGHSVATISRTMSILAAAMNHAVKPVMVEDEAGRREAQVLKYAVPVVYRADAVSAITGKPEPSPRDWLPNWEEMACFIDGIGRRTASGAWDENRENLFRYVVLALNTWARPEAILGLNLRSQIDHEAGIVHLNPAGRRQTKKHRPAVRLTRNLALWLESEEWKDLTYAVHRKSVPLTTIKKVFKAHALKLGMPGFTPYTLRHFMATNVRRVEGIEVSREQRQEWLGHKRQDTTSWYEHHDPEWLREAAEATDAVVERLDGMLAVRSLFPSSSQAALKSSNNGQPRLRLISSK